ncbi:MAG: peptidase M16, partial [Gammaproteobacteria bacterium CG22_combo_CG10-13_8_21_14_all_40_8]
MIYSFFIAGCTPIAHQSNNKVAAVAKDKVFNYPYTEKQLPNGLKVVLVKTQYPNLVSLYIPVSTGSRNEMEPGKSGFAHFFEHMMFRGTKKYPSDKYGEILKNLGADQNAYTTDDYTNYHTTFVAEGLETMLELEADRFQNLEYSEADFKTESLAVKGEYLKNASNPVRKIFEVMRDKAFIKHTYKHTTMGYLKDINDMPNQFEYGKKFFKRWYSPENTSIIVVGDFDEAKAMKWIEKYWSNWKPSNYKADIPVEPEHHQSEYVHITWDKKTQPWLAIGFHGPAYDPSKIDMP